MISHLTREMTALPPLQDSNPWPAKLLQYDYELLVAMGNGSMNSCSFELISVTMAVCSNAHEEGSQVLKTPPRTWRCQLLLPATLRLVANHLFLTIINKTCNLE